MKIRLPITPAAAFAIAIIIATEVVFLATTEPLTGLPLLQPTVDDATLVVKRDLLQQAGRRIMFVGDSSCLMGLDTDSFETAGLERPVNLGSLLNFTLPGFATLAEEAFNRHPQAVVVSVLPRSFEVTENEAHDYGLLGRYLVAYGEQSPNYHVTLADRWSWFVRKHRFNIYPPEWGGSFGAYAARVKNAGGHFEEHGTYTGVSGRGFRSTFKPTEYSRNGFLQLAKAARERGIPLVLWWSPSPSDAVSPAYLSAADQFVDRIRDEVPELYVGRPAPAWEPSHFGSVTHLTPRAAKVNSEQLAEYLAATLHGRSDVRSAIRRVSEQ